MTTAAPLCIVGKYPPIQGGVSSSTYWLARGLAARGHEVHVVTNADQVEPRYRMRLAPEDAAMFAPEFPGGGRVVVHDVEPFSGRALNHIPLSDPLVTRVASLTTDVVRRHGCVSVLAYYFEPYAVAGWMAARWTGRPLLVKHAGSDLDRLARSPDLAVAYREVLRDADRVVTRHPLSARFEALGVRPERIAVDPPYALDPGYFTPDGPRLDLAATALRDVPGLPPVTPRPDLPSIGVYGKTGEPKGTFDLIRAAGLLAAEGREFQLRMMVGATAAAMLAPALAAAGIADRTVALPLLPNWRVPEFVRSCTAVCFLERAFPVAIHGPMVAREVTACGTCLVLSGEIHGKQMRRDDLRSGENLILVPDPREHDVLAAALRSVVDDPARARRIGAAGRATMASGEDVDAFLDGWRELLSVDRGRPEPVERTGREALRALLPNVLPYLERICPALVDGYVADPDAGPAARAAGLCDAVADRIATVSGIPADRVPVLRDLVRYQSARVRAGNDVPDGPPPFAVVDRRDARRLTDERLAGTYPVRPNTAWVEHFDHDVSALLAPWTELVDGTTEDDAVDLTRRRRTLVLFHRAPNLGPRELEIDDATLALLARCDGSRTLDDVVAGTVGSAPWAEPDTLRDRVLDALQRLADLGLLVFGERDPVRGWRGGARSPLEALPALDVLVPG